MKYHKICGFKFFHFFHNEIMDKDKNWPAEKVSRKFSIKERERKEINLNAMQRQKLQQQKTSKSQQKLPRHYIFFETDIF